MAVVLVIIYKTPHIGRMKWISVDGGWWMEQRLWLGLCYHDFHSLSHLIFTTTLPRLGFCHSLPSFVPILEAFCLFVAGSWGFCFGLWLVCLGGIWGNVFEGRCLEWTSSLAFSWLLKPAPTLRSHHPFFDKLVPTSEGKPSFSPLLYDPPPEQSKPPCLTTGERNKALFVTLIDVDVCYRVLDTLEFHRVSVLLITLQLEGSFCKGKYLS